MTSGHASGGPSRGADAPTRTTGMRDGIGAIIAILALGLVLRVIILQLNPGSGFGVDRGSFQFWANNLATDGLSGFYTRPFLHDYTPGYLYVLYLIGVAGQALGGVGDLIKIPPILADIALGWLAWSMAREVGAGRRAALLGAVLVVANPVSWFDSVLWGQVDSFGVVFLLLGMRALWRDRPERAAVFTVIAALIKPQLAILAPLVAVVTIRRALWPPQPSTGEIAAGKADAIPAADEPAQGSRAGVLARVRSWERRTGRPIRILTTGLAGLVTAVVLCYPFGLSIVEAGSDGLPLKSGLLYEMFNTASEYPYASVNTYNPWALATLDGNGVAANAGWACDVVILHPNPGNPACPDAVMIGPLPAVVVGAALLLTAFGLVCLFVARRPTPLTILTGVAILSIAFFILPTRVHERYLFPFIAVGAILAAFSIRWRIAYFVLSGAMFLNMYVVLTTLYPDNPGIQDWLGIGSTLREQSSVTLIALVGLVAALWSFVQLRPGAQQRLERELDSSAAGDEWDEADDDEVFDDDDRTGWAPTGRPATDRAGDAAGFAVGAGAGAGTAGSGGGSAFAASGGASAGMGASAGVAVQPAPMPMWAPAPSFAELGPIGWFRARLDQPPVRADRSRTLDREPPGRLDRLDVWILVVLIASILGLRMFRLAEPYQMHFDEVYHARTATEFLQDWRYGISHDIYEWTHPHLAKYAMAGGLVAWGNDRVTATASLGVPVVDAAIEPRLDDPVARGGSGGQRVDVVTGSELRSYDLATRRLVATIPIPGASAVAVDPAGLRLFVGTTDGTISTVDLTTLDTVAAGATGSGAAAPSADGFGTVDGAIRRLFVPADGSALLVATADDKLLTLDSTTAELRGTVQLKAAGDIADAGTAPAVVGSPGAVTDPAAAASALASALGGEAATYAKRLRAAEDGSIIARISDSDQRTKVQAAIDDGRLAGLSIEERPQAGVADANGVELIDPATGSLTKTVDVGAPAHGLALVTVDDGKLYVATDPDPAVEQAGRIAIVAVGGDVAKDGPVLLESMAMPGAVTRVLYDDASEMVHVLGTTPDGSAATVYVIEPHARAVYADARLPFEPTAMVMDSTRDAPGGDRQQILAFSAAGDVASVDVGEHEFAWRLPGVLAGAAMAGFLYLLARLLFRRRSVGLLVAVISVVDGMFFVQSRIGMNDAYVGLAIVAAYTLFAALWLGVWRHRGAFWIAMPLIGAILGLGLASKWVALYAIGGIAVLIMIRSALGRLLTIIAMIGMTAILGYLAINVPAGSGFGNLPFVAIMVALTVAAVIANVMHPVAWSLDEIRFAVGAPIAIGGLIALGAAATGSAFTSIALGPVKATPIEIAFAAVVLGAAVWVLMLVAARIGFGPLAPPAADETAGLLPPPAPAPPEPWLRPGALLGLPIVWMAICLLVLPVGIYVASYLPWAFIENHRLFGNWPNGHTGQSLIDLTGAMYAYHNGLTAPHAASSPWWAWLFDLKPVWFYQEGLAGNTTAAIYDAGNLVAWWLGLPAIAFAAWQAFSRRSLALALVTIGFACQWVSWARIDRASFQYHYYTSLPFLFLALAYFLAELWHGASRRTWLMARLTAAAAVLGPALFWILDRPLCGFVGVTKANPGSQACPPIIPQFVLTGQTLAMAVVVGVSVIVVVRLLSRLGSDRSALDDGSERSALTLLMLMAIAASLLTIGVRLFIPDVALISLDRIPVEPVAIVLALPALVIAALVATARDARRFVVGAVVALVGWFIVVYPNISALPLPTTIANVYQGVLPTYLYAFQFPVNNVAANVQIHLLGTVPLLLLASMVFLALVVGYSAWVWRLALAERRATAGDRYELGAPGGATGGAGGPAAP